MKEIIATVPTQQIQLHEIERILQQGAGFVAYRSKSNELALLISTSNYYGFIYLSELGMSTTSPPKFAGASRVSAARKAIDAGHTLYLFHALADLINNRNTMTTYSQN